MKEPDSIAYLAYILLFMPQEIDHVRVNAGHLLKNNATLALRATSQAAAYVKSVVLISFIAQTGAIREMTALIIAKLLEVLQPSRWPECIRELSRLLNSPRWEDQEVCATSTLLTLSVHSHPPLNATTLLLIMTRAV